MDEKFQGWINLYKPVGVSSFSAIYKIKKKFNKKKWGHAGTLDPNAEGILPIAINKTTKLIPFINTNTKKYIFKIKWGEQTSTDDSEGEIINYSNKIPKEFDYQEISKKYNIPSNLLKLGTSNQSAFLTLKLVEIIGEDEALNLDPETIYFLIHLLNQNNLKKIRNEILISALQPSSKL